MCVCVCVCVSLTRAPLKLSKFWSVFAFFPRNIFLRSVFRLTLSLSFFLSLPVFIRISLSPISPSSAVINVLFHSPCFIATANNFLTFSLAPFSFLSSHITCSSPCFFLYALLSAFISFLFLLSLPPSLSLSLASSSPSYQIKNVRIWIPSLVLGIIDNIQFKERESNPSSKAFS